MATEAKFQVTGVRCGACAQRLTHALQRVDGVVEVSVDPSGVAEIRYDEAHLNEDTLTRLIRVMGFDLA